MNDDIWLYIVSIDDLGTDLSVVNSDPGIQQEIKWILEEMDCPEYIQTYWSIQPELNLADMVGPAALQVLCQHPDKI